MSAADLSTGLLWLVNWALVLVVCAMLRSKPATVLALALAVGPAFYLSLLVALRDVGEVRRFAADYRTGLIVGPIQFLLLCWSIVLAVRLLRAKPGSRIDFRGRLHLPGPEEIEESLVVLARADVHHLLTEMTTKWGREDTMLNRAIRMAGSRDYGGGTRARLILKLLAPRLYRRATARWALRKVHFERPDKADDAGDDGDDRGRANGR